MIKKLLILSDLGLKRTRAGLIKNNGRAAGSLHIAAVARSLVNATGHVGIVSGPNLTISASSKTGTVVEGDWGFRQGEPAEFYHYTGD